MKTILRRILLAIIVALAAFVGFWAAVFPTSFYSSFPGFGLTWISSDGPFNEHLIRDVGGLYLGFAAAALASMFSKSASPGRVVGLGWALFGVLHLSYHLGHLEGSATDRIGIVVGLGVSLVPGVALLLPVGRVRHENTEVTS
jgi:hypothetical protein